MFNKIGARNWKKYSKQVAEQSHSSKMTQSHLASMHMWETYKLARTTGTVQAKLSHSHQDTVGKKNRVCNTSLFLLLFLWFLLLYKLDLLFQGHWEGTDSEARGNYLIFFVILSQSTTQISNQCKLNASVALAKVK